MSRRIYNATSTQQQMATNSQRWRCSKCGKVLSSKRSYDEHMNVHSGKRPFDCTQCKYAAASQMTLRRHKLRNHIPRNMWGYQCPYCAEAYMEPASYQQHIASRHAGLSATFGCTFCRFDTKSSKHFRKHMLKHLNVVARHSRNEDIDSCSINVSEFLIDDENGRGHCMTNKEQQSTQKPTFSSALCSNTAFLECGPDFFKSPLESKETKKSTAPKSTNNRMVRNGQKQETKYILIKKEDGSEIKKYLVEIDDDDDDEEMHVPEFADEVIIEEPVPYEPPQQKVPVEFELD